MTSFKKHKANKNKRCADCNKLISPLAIRCLSCYRKKNPYLKNSEKWSESRKKNSRGEKNPNWKGGISPLAHQIRNSFKNRQWRSDVFTRDDFTCQSCGIRGGRIEAHHYPKQFSEIFAEYRIKSFEEALRCEEFWNINNGRTLCKGCHRLKRRTDT